MRHARRRPPQRLTGRDGEGARGSRAFGHGPRRLGLLIAFLPLVALLFGCKPAAPSSGEQPASARALFDQASKEFYGPSTEAKGTERERLLSEAARRYSRLLKEFPAETNLCAQSLRALGSIHATRDQTNEAVKLYAAVGEKYGSEDWEVLQAWKSAADLLWESNQRGEARTFYAKVVERFGKSDRPQIIQQVVRGSKARLAE